MNETHNPEADETKCLARKLTRKLILAKLTRPGTFAYIEREDQLFAELMETGSIAGRARQMGASDSPEDVQQRVALRLMVDFREGRLFAISRKYVETTASFDVRTLWRKALPGPLSDEAEADLAAGSELPDAELVDVEARLGRAWSRLSDRQRCVLSLRFPELLTQRVENDTESGPVTAWTLKQIGDAHHWSVATVHRIEGDGVRQLLAGLCDEGLDELAELLGREMT